MKSLHILAEIPIWSRFWNLEASLHVSNDVNTISKYKKNTHAKVFTSARTPQRGTQILKRDFQTQSEEQCF